MNYHNKLKELIASLDYKPTLLLHSCCAPCSTTCLEILAPFFNITVYYYNPNIEPVAEYEKRKQEQIRYLKTKYPDIKIIDSVYENEFFHDEVKGLEKEKQGGSRCQKCIHLRLLKTALKARENNFEYFGTTLTVSSHKNSLMINEIGKELEEEYQIKYLYSDFKKENGYQRSIILAKEANLYRQNYCGCLYGVKND